MNRRTRSAGSTSFPTAGTSLRFPTWGQAILALVVALVQFRMIVLAFGKRYPLSVEAAEGVLRGEPHWRVYQNRLLGPWLVEITSGFVGRFLDAHVLWTILLLTLAGFLVLRGAHAVYGRRERALVAYLAFVLLGLACFQPPWLYIWDFVDLCVFATFNLLVARRKDYRWFVALYLVAIFNRESAWYIALWMIVDPVARRLVDRRGGGKAGRLDLKMLGAGTVLLAAGVVLVEVLRDALLVREIGPTLVEQAGVAGPSFHWMLRDNLDKIVVSLTSFHYALSFLVPAFLVGFLAFCLVVARRDPRGRLALALVHIAMLGSMLAFGIVFETRLYLVLVPFVALNLWSPLSESEEDPPGKGAESFGENRRES
jgi:hypothetical protein